TRLTGKVAIVTGASSGVGEATARLLAAEGAALVLAARTEAPLRRVADSIGGLAVPTDVSRRADLERLVAATVERHGRIDILVNNAGTNVRGNFADIPAEGVEQVIDTNLKAPMLLTHFSLPHLLAARGVVVNVASIAGHVPLPGEASYSASKWGLRGFTFAAGAELARAGVALCVVSPGPITTGFVLDDMDHVPDLVFSQPFLSAEQVGRAVLACVLDRKRERALPMSTLLLAKAAAAAPWLQELLRPMLERKGARVKAAMRAKSISPV
ncbi:MAG TPA: SDR family oxidoreductase, partial [Acetobacteraceae bacterium]|nr:SDR family oxidoreductase [Acetobacteraceae bacterium]